MFEEVRRRHLGFELAGAVEWTRSNRHTGIRRMPVGAVERRSGSR